MPVVKASPEYAAAKPQTYYNIGQAAAITAVTAKMIRHYEAIGLLPKAKRTAGRYRVYSATDLHTLRFVRRARGSGFSVVEIDSLLGLWRNQRRASAEVKHLALRHLAALDRKIEELQAMRATLADLAQRCHGDARPQCPILDDLGGLPVSDQE